VVQVVEERVVSEVDPSANAVEVRERDEKACESVTLLLEELGEVVREFACGRHEPRVSRAVEAS
jgi:hypothetical protein